MCSLPLRDPLLGDRRYRIVGWGVVSLATSQHLRDRSLEKRLHGCASLGRVHFQFARAVRIESESDDRGLGFLRH